MAKTLQLSEFRTEIRSRGEYRAPYISDTELNGYINRSIAHLYDELVKNDPSRYLTQGSISVVSGTESYALPATFYRMVSVNIPDSQSPSGYIYSDRIEWQERHQYGFSVTATKDETRYAIRGADIYFWPTPTWTDTVQIDFIPAYTTLSLDTDTFDGINGWEEFIIADVLIKCAAKASDDANPWIRQREEMRQRIRQAGTQDRARPMTVSNIQSYSFLGGRRYRYR